MRGSSVRIRYGPLFFHQRMEFPPLRDRSNDIVSGLLHLAGTGGAITVLVLLLVRASPLDGWHITGYTLFGSGMILLYLASTSYHLLPPSWPRAKAWGQRLDHALISILIAATYTPVLFIALDGGWRWSLFGVIWGLALLSALIKLCVWTLPAFLSLLLYLSMGWLILIAFQPLKESLTPLMLILLASGGIAYSLGILFFILEERLPPRRYFWMHEIFHVFVLLGSTLHSSVMFLLLSTPTQQT